MLVYKKLMLVYKKLMLVYKKLMLVYKKLMLVYKKLMLVYKKLMLVQDTHALLYRLNWCFHFHLFGRFLVIKIRRKTVELSP
jgi:hypothetical protein